MARDNFTKAVIDKLRTRVANRCSNPDCRVPTTGPSSGESGTVIIGVAAHVTAASVGGPRYNSSLSEKSRKSMENGIWLCWNCSVEIDRDVDRYSVGLLKQWKLEAEQLAKQELGKKLPGKSDAIDTLTAAFTGQSKKLIPEAISNIHKASSNVLEALDSRFVVKSSYVEGMTQFGIFAKQDVPITMNVKKEYVQEYSDKYKQLIDHGLDLTISGSAVSFEGSKLFEELSLNLANGSVQISPQKKKATQKIWLINKKTSVTENFDDLLGDISSGRQSFSFTGTACNDLFIFKYQFNHGVKDKNTSANIVINFSKWSGFDVRTLPYFQKILSLFKKLSEEWNFYTTLEIDGFEMLRSKNISIGESDFVKNTYQILSTIEQAQVLANSINMKITFDSNFSFTEDEYCAFQNAVEIVEGKLVFHEGDLKNNISCDFIVDRELNSLEMLQQCSEPINLKYIETYRSVIRIFGQNILLPNKILNIFSALPRISAAVNTEQLSHGDVVKVELIPAEGFEARIEFESPA